MRKKAEKEIREAAREFQMEKIPIHPVRVRTSLIRKVFDKTLLDMARLGDVILYNADPDDLVVSDASEFLYQGENIYISFSFVEKHEEREKEAEEQTLSVTIPDFPKEMWEHFQHLCNFKEKKTPEEKIRQLIHAYIQKNRFITMD